MSSLFHAMPLQKLRVEHIPALGCSLIITEVFYKFHSFFLECVGFFITWYCLEALRMVVRDKFASSNTRNS